MALQTALANANDKKGCRVCVLFDTGSQRTFIIAKAVIYFALELMRRERFEIKPLEAMRRM